MNIFSPDVVGFISIGSKFIERTDQDNCLRSLSRQAKELTISN